MNFLLADIVEPVVCSVAGSSIFVGIVVRLLFVFRNIGRVKFYFSFLFIGLEYTCLHSQLLIDGHVHHWIMATRGSAYLLRTCSWVCWRLWRFEGETSGHGEWLEVSLFWGYLIYIYNVCLVYRRQVYEEFTEKDGLWHRVKFGFIAEKTIKEGVEVVQCSSYNTI